MIAYASRTGTRRNLAALRAAGWRLMVSARGALRPEGFRFALDNGAWTAHRRGEPFDARAFGHALSLLGPGADFVVVPDAVMDADGTRRLSAEWLPRVLDATGMVLLAVQDGMETDVLPLGPRVGVFVGGSTEWKEATIPALALRAHRAGAVCHVGRVNSARRLAICTAAGADSFDGSSASRYAVTLPGLDATRRQIGLFAR